MMFCKSILIAVVAVVAYNVMQRLLNCDSHPHYNKHYPGNCRHIKGLEFGSEDFQVTSDGLAFITSGVWFPQVGTKFVQFLKVKNIQGSIYLYDFNKPELGARKMRLTSSKYFTPKTFRPHGISLLEDKVKGEHLLYIISHREDSNDAVEKFRYLPKTNKVIHLKSFSGNELQTTNDLAVLEEDKFYITNFFYFKNSIMSYFEQNSLIPVDLGSLVFFNGTGYTVTESRLQAPNGIYLSENGRYLYLNLPRLGVTYVYRVEHNNSVVKLQTVTLNTAADNLHLSQSGDALYTGTHPILYKIVEHLKDPIKLAPSAVLRLPLREGLIDAKNITELFYDHGDLISASSVAAIYNSKLLIGSVINKLVICDVGFN